LLALAHRRIVEEQRAAPMPVHAGRLWHGEALLREVNGRAAATKQEILPFCSADFVAIRSHTFLRSTAALATITAYTPPGPKG
jgi:hypothetical protein